MLYTKHQQNKPCGSGEKVDFSGLAVFSAKYIMLFWKMLILLFMLVLVTAAILKSRPDYILLFRSLGV